MVQNRFDNIRATITNSRESIELNLIGKSRKKIYGKMLEEDDNAEENLDDNVIGKSIYVFC